jgi:hypothetical protein
MRRKKEYNGVVKSKCRDSGIFHISEPTKGIEPLADRRRMQSTEAIAGFSKGANSW